MAPPVSLFTLRRGIEGTGGALWGRQCGRAIQECGRETIKEEKMEREGIGEEVRKDRKTQK